MFPCAGTPCLPLVGQLRRAQVQDWLAVLAVAARALLLLHCQSTQHRPHAQQQVTLFAVSAGDNFVRDAAVQRPPAHGAVVGALVGAGVQAGQVPRRACDQAAHTQRRQPQSQRRPARHASGQVQRGNEGCGVLVHAGGSGGGVGLGVGSCVEFRAQPRVVAAGLFLVAAPASGHPWSHAPHEGALGGVRHGREGVPVHGVFAFRRQAHEARRRAGQHPPPPSSRQGGAKGRCRGLQAGQLCLQQLLLCRRHAAAPAGRRALAACRAGRACRVRHRAAFLRGGQELRHTHLAHRLLHDVIRDVGAVCTCHGCQGGRPRLRRCANAHAAGRLVPRSFGANPVDAKGVVPKVLRSVHAHPRQQGVVGDILVLCRDRRSGRLVADGRGGAQPAAAGQRCREIKHRALHWQLYSFTVHATPCLHALVDV